MLHLFTTKDNIFKKASDLIGTQAFQNCPPLAFVHFLETHKKFFLSKKFNPWELVFYSNIPKNTPSNVFYKLIEDTHNFILQNNLPFSLNDTIQIMGRTDPLLESFFHWGGYFHINKNFFESLEKSGFIFSIEFANSVLSLVQGLEVRENTLITNLPRRWNFEACLKEIELHLGEFELSESNTQYIQECIANEEYAIET